MTDKTQPEALRLAEILEGDYCPDWFYEQGVDEVAAELRRQHTRIAELEAQLEAVGAGGVQALSAAPAAPTVEQVEHEVGMGHIAWDMVDPQKLIGAVLRLAASPTPPAEQQAAPKAAPGELFDSEGFRAWVRKNLPDDTIIGSSAWWADHLTTWAQRFVKAAPQQEAQEPVAWDGAEEWEKLAWHLCAEENGEDACNELIWEGGPMPEPWGDRWLKYEGEARRMIALVRTHVPAPQPAPAPLSEQDEREAVARAIWELMREHEDRCDMELDDLMEDHPIWSYADAACAALAALGGK